MDSIAPGAVTPTETEASIPDEILQIPAFAALLQGAPPAVYVPKGFRTPEVEAVERNIEPLLAAGFGIYKPLDGQSSVLFNTQFITEEELKVADQKGKLDVLAPPLTEALDFFNQNIPQDGAPSAAPTAGAVSAPPPPASVQTKAQTARTNNTLPGGPSDGAFPGQGRLMNAIFKPVV